MNSQTHECDIIENKTNQNTKENNKNQNMQDNKTNQMEKLVEEEIDKELQPAVLMTELARNGFQPIQTLNSDWILTEQESKEVNFEMEKVFAQYLKQHPALLERVENFSKNAMNENKKKEMISERELFQEYQKSTELEQKYRLAVCYLEGKGTLKNEEKGKNILLEILQESHSSKKEWNGKNEATQYLMNLAQEAHNESIVKSVPFSRKEKEILVRAIYDELNKDQFYKCWGDMASNLVWMEYHKCFPRDGVWKQFAEKYFQKLSCLHWSHIRFLPEEPSKEQALLVKTVCEYYIDYQLHCFSPLESVKNLTQQLSIFPPYPQECRELLWNTVHALSETQISPDFHS